MTSRPNPEEWLGLLLVTEAAAPRERTAWPAIAWVVRNRVASRRFPNTVEAVVLQPHQFSRFNDWAPELAEGGPDAVWDAAAAWLARRHELSLYVSARAFAAIVLADTAGGPTEPAAPWGPKVLHYYSPVSMVPPQSVPGWWWREIAREVPVEGVDPNLFRFGESHRG